MADKNKEIIEVEINRADAMKAKHDFFRRFIPIDQISEEDVPLFEKVCGVEFAKEFPKVAKAIRKGMREEMPVLIEGFALGYAPQINNSWNTHPNAKGVAYAFSKRTGRDYHHAHGIFFHSIHNLMGFTPYDIYDGIVTANVSAGFKDSMHDHNEWALVIGIRGVDDVATRLFRGGRNCCTHFETRFCPSYSATHEP